MDEYLNHLQDISEIRALMEQNSKFLSLSGLSGISAGLVALAGAFAAWWKLDQSTDYLTPLLRQDYIELLTFLLVDAVLVLAVALGFSIFFSIRMGKRNGIPIWNKSAQYVVLNLAIPIAAGGIFCLAMVMNGGAVWVAPTMLLFYGLALLNAGKYTQPEIRYLGYSEIVLGLLCAAWPGHGLIFWSVGFGVLHVLYGTIMYFKYER